jgi:hypothetical protein
MEAMPARLRADAQQRFSIPAPFDARLRARRGHTRGSAICSARPGIVVKRCDDAHERIDVPLLDDLETLAGLLPSIDAAVSRRFRRAPVRGVALPLHNELREFVFEEELELEYDLDEPRWGALAAALAASGVAADAEALEALPFVIEVDADASAALRPWQARAASARALGRIGQQRGEACHGEVDPERHGSADAASCSHTFATRTPIVAFGTIFDARSRQ